MKLKSLRLSLAALLALSAAPFMARADIVMMKDGKKYVDAKVLSETADSVTFSYKLTPKIPDTRTEKKADIQQIIKQRPEELAIVPLRKEGQSRDLMTADQYEALIQDKLRPFVATYPGSPEAKEVEGMIAALQAEKEKVVSGQMKLDGQWLTSEEVKREGRNLEAARMGADIKALLDEGKFIDGLKLWSKLSDRTNGYTDTIAYVKQVPEVIKALDAYKVQLDKLLRDQPLLSKKRSEATNGLVEPDLSRTKKAYQDEDDKFKALSEMEKLTHVDWHTPYKYDPKTIQASIKEVLDEKAKLSTLDLTKIQAANEALAVARRYIADQNVEAADAAIKKASEAAKGLTLNTSALSKLKADLTKLKSDLSRRKTAQRLYGAPTALTGTGAATSGTDSRVQEAMDAAKRDKEKGDDGKKDKDDGDAKKGGSTKEGSPSASAKSSSSKASASDEEEKPVKKKSRRDEEEGMSMVQIGLIAVGALLAILLGMKFLGKKS